MLESSGKFVVLAEGRSAAQDRPEYVDASARQGEDGLVVALSLPAIAVAEGAAFGMGERAGGGLVEAALQPLVAAGGPAEEAGLAGLAQPRSTACR
jgi:hypothetical protein